MTHISQREARKLQKRVAELERDRAAQNNLWSSEWPGGIIIDTITVTQTEWFIASTARKLGRALVVVPREGDGFKLTVYAVPL